MWSRNFSDGWYRTFIPAKTPAATGNSSLRMLYEMPSTDSLQFLIRRLSTIINFINFAFTPTCASSILIKACSLSHNLFKVLLLVVSEVIIQFEVIFWRICLAANTLSVRDISFIRLQYNLSLNAVLHQHVLSTAHGGNYRLWATLKDLIFHANHWN